MFSRTSTNFMKEERNLLILEAATYRCSVKTGMLKSMIKLIKKINLKELFSKATGNCPKMLQKRISFTNIC